MLAKKTQRRIAREKALQILYAYDFNQERLTILTEALTEELHADNDKEFAAKLANLVIGHKGELDELIKGKVDNWEIERIALIDRILLRMGIAELLFFEDIPPKVSINEVIEMAKEYSTANSGKFLNGILDAILSDLLAAGKIKKTGRGLLDKSLKK